MKSTSIVTALLVLTVVGITAVWIENRIALKSEEYRPAELRQMTDVEQWKVFLYEYATAQNVSYREYRTLRAIVEAESTWRMYGKDGTVLRGVVNSKDLGLAQINEFYHQKVADELGLNLHEPEGNLKMFVFLYKRDGTDPWRYSQLAWGGKK